MQFSEDDLRAALRRKDPGEGFTGRVMAHVAQAQAGGAAAPRTGSRLRLGELWQRLWLRPALTGAIAATLLVGGTLGLLHYRNAQRREGEAAKQQVLLALRITNVKLNHVIERVKTSQGQ